MEWILRSPQLHSSFGSLGYTQGAEYHINENCNEALETILNNIVTEDKFLHTFRRSISFGKNVQKDIIPLLINTKDDETVALVVKILMNLTIPIECLMSVDVISKTDFGRHTIFEINNLLTSTKAAFIDNRVTKVLMEFLNKNFEIEETTSKLTAKQCENTENGLLLLRNILHIPEEKLSTISGHTVQNQIIWNIFSQRIDKNLINLMNISEASNWSVTMVQLIALLYKDQQVASLHKLIKMWLEATLSESSDDNESNTSPPNRGSNDSSPVTSDPTSTSDSSDTCSVGKTMEDVTTSEDMRDAITFAISPEPLILTHPPLAPPPPPPPVRALKPTTIIRPPLKRKHDDTMSSSCGYDTQSQTSSLNQLSRYKHGGYEHSDCGYGTLIDNQESASSSSNDDGPSVKPVHVKPHNPKQKPNTKARVELTQQDKKKKKKIYKRARTNSYIINALGNPTDEDITHVLKEFTVDFLIKGYNSLVRTLHRQILTNVNLEIDKSHFFWLISYFLKFATQIDLEFEHLCCVLSFDIITYLTTEGVDLLEQFELAVKVDDSDLKPILRRLHLVVTSIREFVQAIELYKKSSVTSDETTKSLVRLQLKICELDELRSLMLLLIRHYNTKHHSKQYLQDLIVTNHLLLVFIDNGMRMPEYNGSAKIEDHIKMFATPEMMYQYGLLLEDFLENGEFINDCVFTMMHHVGGDLNCLSALFQPHILKSFSDIWKKEYNLCDDWTDLMKYVINKFIAKPKSLQSITSICDQLDSLEDEKVFVKPSEVSVKRAKAKSSEERSKIQSDDNNPFNESWAEKEISSLNWNYFQCKTSSDVISDVVKLLAEDGISKSRDSVVYELYKHNIINKTEFDTFLKSESRKNHAFFIERRDAEITKLCEQLRLEGKYEYLEWIQKVLLDTCFANVYIVKKNQAKYRESSINNFLNFEMFRTKQNDMPLLSPVSYHNLILHKSIPLVPWSCEQARICKDLKFLQLFHKLGFYMPVDSGKLFIRIPEFWTAEHLYKVAGKILPIDKSKLKFSISDLNSTSANNAMLLDNQQPLLDMTKEVLKTSKPHNYYQIQKQSHFASIVNFTPLPDISHKREDHSTSKLNSSRLEIVPGSQEIKTALNIANHLGNMEQSRFTQESQVYMPSLSTTCAAHAPAAGECYDEDDSVFETASVASSLTRMYVSDEDDKSEAPDEAV